MYAAGMTEAWSKGGHRQTAVDNASLIPAILYFSVDYVVDILNHSYICIHICCEDKFAGHSYIFLHGVRARVRRRLLTSDVIQSMLNSPLFHWSTNYILPFLFPIYSVVQQGWAIENIASVLKKFLKFCLL